MWFIFEWFWILFPCALTLCWLISVILNTYYEKKENKNRRMRE